LPTPTELPTLDPHAYLPLSVAQVRRLLQAVLPQPVLDLPAVLDLLAYQQRRKRAASGAHRKRILTRLEGLRW
jgi:hypothetical protein